MKNRSQKSKNLWTVSSLLNKNFLVRTLSGVGLLVIVLGAVLWSPFSMLVLMAVLMAGSLTEFFRIARLKGARPLVAYPVVIGLSALALAFARADRAVSCAGFRAAAADDLRAVRRGVVPPA